MPRRPGRGLPAGTSPAASIALPHTVAKGQTAPPATAPSYANAAPSPRAAPPWPQGELHRHYRRRRRLRRQVPLHGGDHPDGHHRGGRRRGHHLARPQPRHAARGAVRAEQPGAAPVPWPRLEAAAARARGGRARAPPGLGAGEGGEPSAHVGAALEHTPRLSCHFGPPSFTRLDPPEPGATRRVLRSTHPAIGQASLLPSRPAGPSPARPSAPRAGQSTL